MLPYHLCNQDLQDLLRSRYPIIFLRSSEESRAVQCIIAAHEAILQDPQITDGELVQWSAATGFQQRISLQPGQAEWRSLGLMPPNGDPITLALDFLQRRLLNEITQQPTRQHTYILPDWSALIADQTLLSRRLKEIAIAIHQIRPQIRLTLVITGAEWSIPLILRNSIHILDLPLPIGDELYDNVFSLAVSKYAVLDSDARRLAEQAQGMPLQAAEQTARLATTRQLWTSPTDTGNLLLEVKKQEIRKTGVLEYYAPQGDGLNDVGGLETVKTWVRNRQSWFEQDTQPHLRPRAILLEGFPGCGKTFIARAIAQEWRVPQINFEISRLQSRWVGESESNTFQALRAIEAAAPNILFMDEIEKAFAGVGGDSSGVSTRQFGTFLSWLNDHHYPIFFIATSNDRDLLPPELFRAGRFDETFIVMPPNTQERSEILQKRCAAYRLAPIPNDTLQQLVSHTIGFSGAELDRLVKEAIYQTHNANEITTTHWEIALTHIKPQYKTQRMQQLLTKYQQQLNEGGKFASIPEPGFLEQLILN